MILVNIWDPVTIIRRGCFTGMRKSQNQQIPTRGQTYAYFVDEFCSITSARKFCTSRF